MKKFLIWTGIIVAVLAAVILITPVFLPSNVTVERSVEIAGTPEQISAKITHLKEWEKWAVWWKKDSEMKAEYKGEPGTVGSSSTWTSAQGPGTMTVKQISSDAVDLELAFGENREHVGTCRFEFEPANGGTKVVWVSDFELTGVAGKWMGLFMEGMMAPDLEKGLDGLKKLVEGPPAQ